MNILLQIVLIALCVGLFGFFALYSNVVLRKLTESQTKIGKISYKLFGNRLTNLHTKVTRRANLNRQSKFYKIYAHFDNIIVNLDMKSADVTVSGMLVFIFSISLSLGVLLSGLMGTLGLLIPLTLAFTYLINVLFTLAALLKYEKREAEIMDAVDLLVSDIQGGVSNAIHRYKESFHPNIRPYFTTFIDDVQHKGYSFKEAMLRLNTNLGGNFTDFAQKAIIYEAKAGSKMDTIFSSIIEVNRQRRTLRYINNIKFAEMRMQFLVSLAMILGYAVFTTIVDPFIITFLTKTFVGRMLVIGDIVLITWVLSYLAAIKAKSL